jgi:hypothetical protein
MTKQTVTLKPGEFLFQENDPSDGVFILREGFVEIGKKREDEFVVLSKMHSGDVIGSMSLFTHEPRTAAARALSSAQLIHIDAKTVESSFSNLPIWVQAVLKDCILRLKVSSEELVESRLREKKLIAKVGTSFHLASQFAALLAFAVRTGAVQDEGLYLFPLKGFFERCEGILLKRVEDLEQIFLAFMKGSLLKAEEDKKWGRSIFSPNAQLLEDFSVFCLQVAKQDFANFVPSKFMPLLPAFVRISKKDKERSDYSAIELIEKVKAECAKTIDSKVISELVRLRVLSQVPATDKYSWVERQIQRRMIFESTCRFVKDAQVSAVESKVA